MSDYTSDLNAILDEDATTVDNSVYHTEIQDEHDALIIDKNTREIISVSNETLVVGDANSAIKTFVIDRYYDGVDLSTKSIKIVYVRSDGEGDVNDATDIQVSTNQITFSWLLNAHSLFVEGDLSFIVEFIGTDESGDEYIFKTKTCVLRPDNDTLNDINAVSPAQDWVVEIESRISALESGGTGSNIDTVDGVFTNSLTVGSRASDSDIGGNSSAFGANVTASNYNSHAEGNQTTASGHSSHSEGERTVASGEDSHSEGSYTEASGTNSHAEGSHTEASGTNSHAEGGNTTSSYWYTHAEGYGTTSSGNTSHAEGNQTKATYTNAHAEGDNTVASGHTSHAEGCHTEASAYYSHAEGYYTTASGRASHAEGIQTIANSDCQHVQGKYNNNLEDSLFEVGNGASETERSNAFRVTLDGVAEAQTDVTLQDGTSLKDISDIVASGGTNGKSAYEIAVENGFKGTEVEWLASLKGDSGEQGTPGQDLVHQMIIDASEGVVSRELTANVLCKFSGVLTDLTISLGTAEGYAEYNFIFTTADTGCNLAIPADVVWNDNTAPSLEASKKYEVSILDGVAMISKGVSIV